MPSINIGLIGLGTVGCGVVKTLQKNQASIKEQTGLDLNLKKIADIDLERERPVNVPKEMLTANVNDILDDPEIDVVIELIGGYSPAKEFVLKAVENGKFVVTANKALIAKHGLEILEAARKNNVDVYFEAAVGGGIPLLLPMGLSLSANRIESIYGILNGTCNYILTKMTKEGKSFETALKEAQEKGFAEADPALDINGSDSMHKLVILASLANRCFFNEKDVFVEGIEDISQKDIQYANELGYCIKLLAIAKFEKEQLSLRVHPTMVPKEHMLSKVENEVNAVFLRGDIVGDLLFSGKGAGMMPTASAVVADLINVAQDISNELKQNVRLIGFEGGKKIKTLSIDEIESRYYLRIEAQDKPGVLAKFSEALGGFGISISSVIQTEDPETKTVPVVITTHRAKESAVKKAIEKIEALDSINGKVKLIRIADL